MPKSAKKENYLLHFILASFAIIVLSLSMFCLSTYFENQKPKIKVLGAQIDLPKEREFWQKIVNDSPTYRDGWLELAKIDKEMGNLIQANKELVKARQIDPNFEFSN